MENVKNNTKFGNNTILKKSITALTITLLAFLIVAVFGSFVFYSNDDKQIVANLSGTYVGHPTHYSIFISQLISYPIKILYSQFPSVPFYGILFLLILFVSTFTIIYNNIKWGSLYSTISSIIISVIVVFGMFFYHFANSQFTIVAVFPAMSSISILFNMKSNDTIRNKILKVGGVFIFECLSCAIRIKVFLLSLPFLGLVILYSTLKDKKLIKLSIFVCLAVCLAFGINKGIDTIVFSKDAAYNEYVEYNQIRGELFDYYGFPKYEEAQELYDELGITEDVLNLIEEQHLIELEDANYHNLKAIYEYQKSHIDRSNRLVSSIRHIIKIYKQYNWIELILILAILICGLCKVSQPLEGLFIVLLYVGAFMLSFIISYLMKFPSRICTCINMLILISMISLNKNMEIRQNHVLRSNKIFRYVMLVSLLLSLVYPIGMNIYETFRFNTITSYRIDEKIQLEQIIREDSDSIYYYMINVSVPQTEYLLRKSQPVINEYFCSWDSRSPLTEEHIRLLGYNSLEDMFANANNLKFITRKASDISEIKAFFDNRYNREMQLYKEIDSIEETICIYTIV